MNETHFMFSRRVSTIATYVISDDLAVAFHDVDNWSLFTKRPVGFGEEWFMIADGQSLQEIANKMLELRLSKEDQNNVRDLINSINRETQAIIIAINELQEKANKKWKAEVNTQKKLSRKPGIKSADTAEQGSEDKPQ